MKSINIIVDDQDAKVLEGLLKRMDIDYTQKTIKEVDDPEALKKLSQWKKSPMLTEKETKEALKKAGINI